MTPAAWIAFAGLFFAIVVQTVGLAFWLGGMSARMRNIEGKPPPNDADCAKQLAALTAMIGEFKEGVSQRFGSLEEMVRTWATHKPSPRRRGEAA